MLALDGDETFEADAETEKMLGNHFMLFELTDDVMHFQVVSGQGSTVDFGAISRPPTPAQLAIAP